LHFSVDPLSVGLDQFTCTVPDRCYTQEIGLMLDSCARRRAWVQKSQARRCRVTVLGKLFTPIVPGSLPPGLWLTSPAGWVPRTGISSGTLRSAIEYWLPLLFFTSDYLRYLRQKTICNPLSHPTWKCTALTCEVPNFFYLTEGLHCTCIFRRPTCVFHPCRFVLAFSVHAFSILAKCAVSYLPFPYLRFPVLASSAPPFAALIRIYSHAKPPWDCTFLLVTCTQPGVPTLAHASPPKRRFDLFSP